MLPCCQQSRSICSCHVIMRNGSSPSMSSGRVSTTIPLFDHLPPRLLGLMPLTTICCVPVAAGMTNPPGHMQNE